MQLQQQQQQQMQKQMQMQMQNAGVLRCAQNDKAFKGCQSPESVGFFVIERRGMGRVWRMIFWEVQKIKGDCDAGWNVDGGRRLPWVECCDSGGCA
jgi:hypothetical protein